MMGNVVPPAMGRRRRDSLDGYEMIEDHHNEIKHRPSTQLAMSTARGGGAGRGDEEAQVDRSEDGDRNKMRGRAILLLVAFLYGTLNVVLRQLYATPGPPSASMLSSSRGWLAALCFLPAMSQIRQEVGKSASGGREISPDGDKQASLVRVAIELAFWNAATQGLVNVGLLFTESARASFLTQTSVVITPLISSLQGNRVGRNVWMGCAAALAGLALLSTEGGDSVAASADGIAAGFSGLSFSGGDLLVLGGAVCWSIYIVRTAAIGDRYPEVSLQAVKTVALAMMYTSWLIFSAISCFNSGGWDAVAGLWLGWQNLTAWALLLYSAVGPGALADVLQQNGQKQVSASEANVILCSEPIFTAILAFLIAGETTSATENAGGALVILAAVIASTSSLTNSDDGDDVEV